MDKNIAQLYSIRNTEKDTHKYVQIIFDKGAKIIPWRKKNGYPLTKKNPPNFILYIKIKSKCIVDLHKHKTKNLLEKHRDDFMT